MKVLNVNMTLDPIMGGGTAERTFQLSRFMAKSGITCTVLTTDIGLTAQRQQELENVKVIALPALNQRFYLPKFSYKQIKNIVKEHDVIQLLNHWTILNALVYFIVRHLNKPYVFNPAGAIPIYGRSKRLKAIYNLIVGHKIISNANKVIAISPNEIPYLREHGANDNISLIPNGIDTSYYNLNKNDADQSAAGRNKRYILFVGRLNDIKGPDLLLLSFNQIKDKFQDHHLVFIGPDGGMLSELQKMSADLGIQERVHFRGYVGGNDKVMAYHAADLLVIPSRQEAMSIVVLEAGAAGTPVLLTDRCGFNEIEDIDGGLVVGASLEGLTQGLTDLLGNKKRLTIMGKNLKKYVFEHYTWEAIVQRYCQLFTEILDKGTH